MSTPGRRDPAGAGRDAHDEALLRRLPTAHAIAVRLDRHGSDASQIAAALGIDIDAVGPLLEIARRKLDALREPSRTGPDEEDSASAAAEYT